MNAHRSFVVVSLLSFSPSRAASLFDQSLSAILSQAVVPNDEGPVFPGLHIFRQGVARPVLAAKESSV
jgi:hypothetical protein